MLNSPGFRSVICSLYCVSSSLRYVKSSCCWHLKTSNARLSVKALTEPSDCCRSSSPDHNDFRYRLLSPQKCPSAQGHHREVESGLAECSNEKGRRHEGSKSSPSHPQKINVVITSASVCDFIVLFTRLGPDFSLFWSRSFASYKRKRINVRLNCKKIFISLVNPSARLIRQGHHRKMSTL